MSADELNRLEDWVEPVLASLSQAEQKKLGREIAVELQKENLRNMKAQRGPDGQAWEGRKKARPRVSPVRYMYRTLDNRVRELEMSSWRDDGDRLIGYDKEAGGIRTMLKSGMLRKLSPMHGDASPRASRLVKHMMPGLSKARHLRIRLDGQGFTVGFSGRAERIARIHHFGLRDQVAPGGPDYEYPERRLLGISPSVSDRIQGMVLDHLTS